MKRHSGFTLVELMIALTILALMMTLAYQSVSMLLEASRQVAGPQAELQQLQRALLLVERDLQQMVPRKRNNGYGEQEPAILQSSNGNNGLLEFTRGGNPDLAWQLRASGQMRSNLQRVRYVLEENRLLRQNWDMVDYATPAEPVSQVLLENVKTARFRFKLQKGQKFTDSLKDSGGKLPVAIEFELDHERFGKIRRLFVIYI